MFSYEYCEIFFTEHHPATASGSWIWKHFSVATNLFLARRITKQFLWNWRKPVLALTGHWCGKRFISWNLCCSNGFVLSKHIAKSNLLNKIEIKRYSLVSLMRNPDLGATVTDFMAMLQLLITASSEDFLM